MSKDYKAIPTKSTAAKPAPAAGKPKPAGKGSPLMVGLLIGLLVGLALSLGVAFFVKSGGSAFQEKAVPAAALPADKKTEPEPPTPAAAVATPDAGQISSESLDPNKKPAEADKKEDRFTFYGILTEKTPPAPVPDIKEANQPNAVTPPATPDNPAAPGTPKAVSERYYLQVGAFQTEKEADNTKARLSLIGMDAIVQTATIPDKGVLHRVRVGPVNAEDLNRIKTELGKNGFNAEAVKVSN
jgi:cell division protein FtsN